MKQEATTSKRSVSRSSSPGPDDGKKTHLSEGACRKGRNNEREHVEDKEQQGKRNKIYDACGNM